MAPIVLVTIGLQLASKLLDFCLLKKTRAKRRKKA